MTHDQIQQLADILEPALRHCLQTEFFPKSIPGALPGTLAHWGWWMQQLASEDGIQAWPGQAPQLDLSQRFSDFLHTYKKHSTYAEILTSMLLSRGLDKMLRLTRDSAPDAGLQLNEFDLESLKDDVVQTMNRVELMRALAHKVEMICGEQTLRELFTFQPAPLARWVNAGTAKLLGEVADAAAASRPLPDWVQYCDERLVRQMAGACAA